jgi:hypothetical protein
LVRVASKGTEIIFELPLSEIVSINKEKYGLWGRHILTARDGSTFPLQFAHSQEKWMQTITDAVKRAVPTINAERIGERVDFH